MLTGYPQPLISVLLPTRGRPVALRNSVMSLVEKAESFGSLEFIFRIDDDDPGTLAAVGNLLLDLNSTPVRIQLVEGPRGNGLLDAHLWLNDMAAKATAPWLLIWNDDAQMLTEGWDRWLGAHPLRSPAGGTPPLVLGLHVEDDEQCYSFAAIRKDLFALLGHLSDSSLVDEWVWRAAHYANAAAWLPAVRVYHRRQGDSTQSESSNGRAAAWEHLLSREGTRGILRDALKIQDYLWGETSVPQR